MSQEAIQLIKKCLDTKDKYLDLGNCGLTDADVAEGTETDRLLRQCTHLQSISWSSEWFELKAENDLERKVSQNGGSEIFFTTHPPALSVFTQLKALVLGGSDRKNWQITQMEFVAALHQLEFLWLAYNQIAEIKGLEGLPALSHLNLSWNRITEIKALEGLTTLNVLWLRHNEITKIKGLKDLPNLTTLLLGFNRIIKIEGIENLSGLVSLDLSGNQIKNIQGLDCQIGIKELYLGGNQIIEIKGLDRLSALSLLSIQRNQITEIIGLEGLTALSILDLGENQITEIKGLDGCIGLNSLDLRCNQITEIKGLEGLQALSSLDFYDNQITEIKGLEGLTALNILDLRSNKITEINGLEGLTTLNSLDLRSNKITEIKGLKGLATLNSLDLGSNQITGIKGLEGLTALDILDLRSNKIIEIKGMEGLTTLNSLDLGGNQITEIKGLEGLTSLKSLDLSNNQITEIQGLECLTVLNNLNLSNNQITKIKGLSGLTALKSLNLNDNQIAEPKGLAECKNLEILQVANNNIRQLPTMLQWPPLQKMRVKGNPLRNFPAELHEVNLLASCWRNWLVWQAALAEGATTNYQLKMMLCGNGNVGKSSLVEALKKGRCEIETPSTHGIIIDSGLRHHDDKVLYTWDMGGQEIFHGTHQLFLESSALQVLVFDNDTEAACFSPDRVNREESVRNHPLEYWLEMVRENNRNNPVIIVQNKVDGKTVPIHNGHNQLANHSHYPFVATCAKTGAGIKRLQFYIDEQIETMPEYEMEIPAKWQLVKEYYLSEQKKEKSNQPIISRAQFEQTAAEYGIASWAWPALLTWLHNGGVVYDGKYYLDGHIIVHQRWALDIIYRVLKRDGDFYRYMRVHNQGFCQLGYLWKEWGGSEEAGLKQLLTGFMRSCAICFPLNDHYGHSSKYHPRATYVFPEFLSCEMPFVVNQKLQDRQARPRHYYRYGHRYIGYKAMQQVLVAYGAHTRKEWYWRNGLMIVDEHNAAFLLLEYLETGEEQEMQLTVDGCFNKGQKKTVLEKLYGILGRRKEGWQFSEDGHAWQDVELETVLREGGRGEQAALAKVEDVAPLKIAISYAKEDNTDVYGFNPFLELLDNLRIYESSNQFRVFCDENIDESNWDEKIRNEFKEVDLIILLNSVHYNKSEKKYIWEVEMPIIEEQYKKPGLRVLRMNVSECNMRPELGKFYDFKSPKIPVRKQQRDKYFRDFVQQQIFEKTIEKK